MCWVLIGIYSVIIIVHSWILYKMWYSKTGLKWDPVSIVDLLALFHGSNVLSDFEDLEFEPGRTASDLLSDKHYRLGYWEKGVDREIWYGIGRRHLGAGKNFTKIINMAH